MKHIDTFDVLFTIKADVKEQIKKKLYADDTTKYGVGGVYKGHHPYLPLSFFYICRGYYLQVTIEHLFIEGIETADTIINQILQIIIEFFRIDKEDIILYETVLVEKLKIKKSRLIRGIAEDSKRSSFKLKDSAKNKRFRSRLAIQRKLRKQYGNQTYRKRKKTRLYAGYAYEKIDKVEINRIEYKNDSEVSDIEKLIISDIFRICAEKRNNRVKVEREYLTRKNCSYEAEADNYVAINAYFKEYERLEAHDFRGARKYKSILRTEVKVKNAHLNYQKQHNKITKTLKNYFSVEMAQKYFKKYVEPIFYTEPFYRIDRAIVKIYETDSLKMFTRDRLCKFLTEINNLGITEAKQLYDASTFRNYIKKIRALNINPICFSKVIDGKKIEIKQIKNFSLFCNSIKEDI